MTTLEKACFEIGIIPRQGPTDGRWHRTDANTKNGKKDGAILFFPDGTGGIVKNWQTGEQKFFWLNSNRIHFKKDKINLKKRYEREIEKVEEQKAAAKKAFELYKMFPNANPQHLYLVHKKVKAHKGVKQDKNNNLVIPVYISSDLTSLQFISPKGRKVFLRNGKTSGGYFQIGEINKEKPICIAEGYATAASIHEASSYPCLVAFNAGNLMKVATFVRDVFPSSNLIICGDSDSVGKKKAIEAALAIRCKAVFPRIVED